jgi:hypothetical protein
MGNIGGCVMVLVGIGGLLVALAADLPGRVGETEAAGEDGTGCGVGGNVIHADSCVQRRPQRRLDSCQRGRGYRRACRRVLPGNRGEHRLYVRGPKGRPAGSAPGTGPGTTGARGRHNPAASMASARIGQPASVPAIAPRLPAGRRPRRERASANAPAPARRRPAPETRRGGSGGAVRRATGWSRRARSCGGTAVWSGRNGPARTAPDGRPSAG